VVGSCKYGDEPAGSDATELVSYLSHKSAHIFQHDEVGLQSFPKAATCQKAHSHMPFRIMLFLAWNVFVINT
jgi:hypothetical protein